MLSRAQIADTIQNMGYYPEFRFVFNKKGYGRNQLWVIARQGRHNRWLGIYDEVRSLSEQELRYHIQFKFGARNDGANIQKVAI